MFPSPAGVESVPPANEASAYCIELLGFVLMSDQLYKGQVESPSRIAILRSWGVTPFLLHSRFASFYKKKSKDILIQGHTGFLIRQKL